MIKFLKIVAIIIAILILYVSVKNTKRQQRNPEENIATSSGEVEVDNGGKGAGEELSESGGLGVGEVPSKESSDSGKLARPRREEIRSEVEQYIREIFQTEEAISWALGVSECESNNNPDAISPSGKYIGIYQFCHSTFDSNCVGSIYEWRDQVVCAKKLYDKGETGRWPNCP